MPRSATCSTTLSLGNDSFLADDSFDYEDSTSAAVTGLPSPASSFESDAHKNKKLKKTKEESRKSVPVMNIAATGRRLHLRTGAEVEDCAQRSYQSHRKQSLAEDPSKTFVYELCNRQFRRQEHLRVEGGGADGL
ncbi:hypothetical protein FHL15_002920 [Xylaria flabelliformis]|uniref:Uncharacterized protein n=1 Tax=Xylaria flabelliformis TaxID=2512241 RepID=A0A553I7L7_9PEZI|nr:hypothetical protein FHL15_002920 [Xylaria flabelliformis]